MWPHHSVLTWRHFIRVSKSMHWNTSMPNSGKFSPLMMKGYIFYVYPEIRFAVDQYLATSFLKTFSLRRQLIREHSVVLFLHLLLLQDQFSLLLSKEERCKKPTVATRHHKSHFGKYDSTVKNNSVNQKSAVGNNFVIFLKLNQL